MREVGDVWQVHAAGLSLFLPSVLFCFRCLLSSRAFQKLPLFAAFGISRSLFGDDAVCVRRVNMQGSAVCLFGDDAVCVRRVNMQGSAVCG